MNYILIVKNEYNQIIGYYKYMKLINIKKQHYNIFYCFKLFCFMIVGLGYHSYNLMGKCFGEQLIQKNIIRLAKKVCLLIQLGEKIEIFQNKINKNQRKSNKILKNYLIQFLIIYFLKKYILFLKLYLFLYLFIRALDSLDLLHNKDLKLRKKK